MANEQSGNEPSVREIVALAKDHYQRIYEDAGLLEKVAKVADLMTKVFQNKGKVLLCGNGGSAADAQHIATELSGRFYLDRPGLFAEALHVNTSFLTAVANDYDFTEVYARAVQAKAQKGDLLIALSTSGNSANVLRAMETAREAGMSIVAFTGETGGKAAPHCDILLNLPSSDTPRIQECHMLIGHAICELVEEALFTREAV